MKRVAGVILTALLMFAPVAAAGVLRTRDGRVFDGELSVEAGGAVRVAPKVAGGLALSFPLSDVATMTFRRPLGGAPSGGALPGEWGVQDIGMMGVSGSSDYAQGEFTLRGEGAQFGSMTDDVHLVYRRMPSDGQLIARVQSLSARDSDLSDVDPGAMAGLMIRKTLEPNSAAYGILLTADEGPRAFVRTNSDSAAILIPVVSRVKIKPPYWLQLTRANNQVSTAISVDGKTWELIDKQSMPALAEAHIGMFVSSHRGDQLATAAFDHVRATIHGLQGEYFADTQFKNLRLTRIDPAINFNWAGNAPDASLPANDFSVRWTGQVLAPSTDAYRFALAADTAARLFINGQMVLDTRSRVPRSGVVNLVMDKRYDLRVDYYEGTGNPTCRLFWSSSTQPDLQIIAPEHLYYTPATVEAAAPAALAPAPAQAFSEARGVLLTDGSFLPGSVKSADEKIVRFAYRDRTELPIPRDKIAWLVFHPLSVDAAAKLPAKGAGLLTLAGDYIEGECQEIAGGKAKLSSVVFGVSTFDTTTQAAAIQCQPVGASSAAWTIHTSSGGVIRAAGFKVESKKLMIDEPLLGAFEMNWGEVMEIGAAELGR